VNSNNFQAASEAIRIKTQPQGERSDEQTHQGENIDSASLAETSLHAPESTPVIVPYAAFNEPSISTSGLPSVAREHTTAYAPPKRAVMIRRPSPAYVSDHSGGRGNEVDPFDEQGGTVHQLTERLDQLRTELQLLEEQERDEESEYTKQHTTLVARKEELQLQQGKRENESKELKRLVTSLEQANVTAQRKRTAHEKVLQQKLAQRERLQEDAQRWEREVAEMRDEAAQIASQKETYARNSQQRVQDLRDEQEPDLQEIRSMEEQVRLTGIEVKNLEEEKRIEDEAAEKDLADYKKTADAGDALWRARELDLHQRYIHASSELHAAQTAYHAAVQRSGYMSNRRVSQAAAYAPIYPTENMPAMNDGYQGESQSRALNGPPSLPAYTDYSSPDLRQGFGSLLRNQAGSESDDAARSSSPFFNANTIMTSPTQPSETMSEVDVLTLTGGALMSPSANNLLPSDLLGDDLEDMGGLRQIPPEEYGPLVSPAVEDAPLRTLPGHLNLGLSSRNASRHASFSELLPGLGAVPGMRSMEPPSYVPNSPGSLGSRSPSLVSSPHSSNTNLHYRHTSDSFLDSDRRSVRSVSSTSQAARPTGRFETFFSGRQRGKTTSDEGPALGSLKLHESRSVPRHHDEDGLGVEPQRSEPKRVTSLGSRLGFGNSSASRPQLSSSNLGDPGLSAANDSGTAKFKALGMLGSRALSWRSSAIATAVDRSASPRPSSTYSLDNALPPPEAGSKFFGWNNSGSSGQAGDNSTLWSTIPNSRRPSMHRDLSDRPKHEFNDLAENNFDPTILEENVPQAPIGTRPSKEEGEHAPQLNPSAPYFKMLGRDKKSDKSPGKSYSGGKGANHGDERYTSSGDGPSSPLARDHKLGSAAESLEDLAESHAEDGLGAQDSSLQPESIGKESFMRKMTRKGSSSRFTLPSFKEKGGIFSRKTEDDNGTLGASVGSLNSAASPSLVEKRSAFSLTSLRKRSKKGPSAPSISETSMTSETGDEDESRASVDT